MDKSKSVRGCPNIKLEEIEKYNSDLYKCDVYFTPNGDYDKQEYDAAGAGKEE